MAKKSVLVHGISIPAGAPSINHLFFANDSLLFCDATLTEVGELKRIFQVYEDASRQRINFAESVVCFSPSTGYDTKQVIHHMLDVPIVPCHEQYMGLPTVAGKDKKRMFRNLKDRI
ncbi:hypothetical protein ACFX1T_022467 [Malus domestica]